MEYFFMELWHTDIFKKSKMKPTLDVIWDILLFGVT